MSNLHLDENWNEIKAVQNHSSVVHKCIVASAAAEMHQVIGRDEHQLLIITRRVTQRI